MRLTLDRIEPAEVAARKAQMPRAFAPSPRTRAARALGLVAFGLLFVYCLWRMDFSPSRILGGLSELGWLMMLMMPPWHEGYLGDFLRGLAETLAMAFLGTLFASLLAIPLGFLGARNVIPNGLFHFGLRRFLDTLRGVDTLIWALIFVSVVGLGPFAGILAIIVSDTGTLGKLYAEAIENIDRRPVDGVRAAGANRMQLNRFGIVPQVLPVIVSQSLYFFESNTRSATILGIVGAGGIGLQLSDRIRVNEWDQVAFIIIMILIMVSTIDYISRALRLRLIGAREQML